PRWRPSSRRERRLIAARGARSAPLARCPLQCPLHVQTRTRAGCSERRRASRLRRPVARSPEPRRLLAQPRSHRALHGARHRRCAAEGLSVLLAAADTFRAAAIEQLEVWAQRSGAEFAAQQPGADPGAVVFDALQAARARGIDVMLADTAGRLHSQSHLMEELKKVRRVIQRVDPSAPHEVLLVLDANQGQNALTQARQFSEAVGVTGLVLTKLDGTARGGIVIAIAQQLRIPIRFIGVGESLEDFGEFDPAAFAAALLEGPQAGCAAAGQTGAA